MKYEHIAFMRRTMLRLCFTLSSSVYRYDSEIAEFIVRISYIIYFIHLYRETYSIYIIQGIVLFYNHKISKLEVSKLCGIENFSTSWASYKMSYYYGQFD